MFKGLRLLASSLCVCFAVFVAAEASAQKSTLRIATLAPKNSSWGKVFKKWKKLIESKTDGKLELKIYYNAVQGDERSMVAKMRSKQIDGASLTSVGLSTIYKPVMVLQLPGIVDSWAVLDKVRAGLKQDIDAGFAAKGFEVVAWGDIGRVHQMSKGFAVRSPADVRGKSPVMWRNEPMAPVVYSVIGGVTPVPLGPAEVLPALRSGKVTIINAPALATEQLQWAPYLDHIGEEGTVCAIGGTVFRKGALEALDPDVKAVFSRLQKKLSKRSSKKIRKLDAQAYKRLAKKMKVVRLTNAERAEWEKVLTEAVKRLAQGTYPKPLIEKAIRLSGKKVRPQ